jgi:hypothetical protein
VTTRDVGKSVLGRATLLFFEFLLEVVGTESLVAGQTLDERVAEHVDVTRRFPHRARQNDRRVKTDDVGTVLYHRLPPLTLDVLFEFNSEWTVIPRRTASAIDFAGLKHESTSFRERNDGIESVVLSHGSPLGRA